MSPELKDQLAQMSATLTRLMTENGGGAGAPPAAPGGWLTPPTAHGALPTPVGWSVVMEIEMAGPRGPGKATLDLCYGPETWGQAPQIVAALVAQGYPVKVWTSKPAYGGGGFPPRGGGYAPRPAWGG